MRKTAVRLSLLLSLIAPVLSAATTRNDDSCDVSVMPAATLLLPYFEVEVAKPPATARTTLFTVINTSNQPQIAKVTLWTDYSYPVLEFQIFLTGYDVQAINLWDVLARGVLLGSSNRSTPGSRSLLTNAKFLPDATATCGNLPGQLPPSILADIQNAFSVGTNTACGSSRIGSANAPLVVGYATIDLVATCRYGFITEGATFDTLLYDNVLTGDWQLLNPDPASGNFASGTPLVHLRAIPEGGSAGERIETNLPYTFYDRFGGAPRRFTDRRQPLPSAFAARYIQGGASGFDSNFLVWREGRTGPTSTCADYRAQNGELPISGIVRFDERENPTTTTLQCAACLFPIPFNTRSTSSLASTSQVFPPLTSGDTSGWMAFNFDNGGATTYGAANGRDFKTGSSTTVGPRPSQSWLVPVLVAEGRYSAAREATALANGCSPSPALDPNAPTNIPIIGPGANPTP